MTDPEALAIAALRETSDLTVEITRSRLLLLDERGRLWGSIARTGSLLDDVRRLGAIWAAEVTRAGDRGAEA
jgi:hypothetical protein